MQQTPSKQAPGGPAWPADAIRPFAVPQVAPPYDDEPASALAGAHDEWNEGQRAGAARRPPRLPGQPRQPGQTAAPQPAEHGAGRPGGRPVVTRSVLASRHGPDSRGSGAGTWPRQFAQVLAETLAGSRSQRQLVPWTTEQVRRQIRELGPLFATGDRPLVRRVMTASPASGVLELTAVVGFGARVRVLALRLEREHTGRAWCCTAFEST